MINVKTDKPIAIDSLDHKHPYGVINDNNSSSQYILEVKNYFKNNKISVLDLGCAGGQIIVDHHNLDDLSVGLEGSSNVLNGAGKHNWEQYHNKNLFLCDITEPFTCLHDSGEIVNFGYRKSANILFDLLNKSAGHKFTADLEVSNTSGRLYNTETLEVAEAYFKVEKMQKQRKVLDMQIAQFTV
jgi:hypothetical protein